jgi:integrase
MFNGPHVDRDTECIFEQPNLTTLRSTIPVFLNAESIPVMDRASLLSLQKHLGLGGVWGEWVYPDRWMPSSRASSDNRVNIHAALREVARSIDELELAITTITKLVLLCLCFPTRSGLRPHKMVSCTFILGLTKTAWIHIVMHALRQTPSVEYPGKLFNRLIKKKLEDDLYVTKSAKREIPAEIGRIRDLTERKLWVDPIEKDYDKGQSPRLHRRRQPFKVETRTKVEFLPLPDEFVHQMGRRSAWITLSLMPQLLSVFEEVLKIRRAIGRNNGNKMIKALLEMVEWRTPEGSLIENLPFSVDAYRGTGEKAVWPPTVLDDLQAYIAIGQSCHYFIAAVSTGPRASEILSWETDCLVEAIEKGIQLINGKTYKLIDKFGGANRDWPLPTLAVQAIHNQIHLTRLVVYNVAQADSIKRRRTNEAAPEPVALDTKSIPLWREIRTRGRLTVTYNNKMRELVSSFGLNHLLDDQELSNHRYRKTLARLVALALVNAPKILMDIFGHKSIKMTIHYIMADKTIRAQIKQISKELRIMSAEDAAHNIDNYGGKAAGPMQRAVKEIKWRQASDYGAADEHELAVMWTSRGKVWNIVRAGVFCTKKIDQVGLCAKGTSRTNPTECTSQCLHRLEKPENRVIVDEILAWNVKKFEQAIGLDNLLASEYWKGQILAELSRFEDLNKKWCLNRTVAQILASN